MTTKHFRNGKRASIFVAAVVVAGVAAIALGNLQIPSALTESPSRTPVSIGLALQPSGALMFIARDKELFDKHGLDPSFTEYASGKRAMVDGLFSDKVDVVTAADVPITINGFGGNRFKILATVFTADNVNRVIARRSAGISTPKDLQGKRVGTQESSAVHFFYHLFHVAHGLGHDATEMVYLKAEELPGALARRDIDAFSMREPYISEAAALLGEDAVIFSAPGAFVQSESLVISSRFMNEHPEVCERLIRALLEAEHFARENKAEAQDIVARALSADRAAIEKIWETVGFRVSLDQFLLIQLEDIGRWTIELGIAPTDELPNYLNLFHVAPLKSIEADRVSLIR